MARNARCIQMYSSVTSDRCRLREVEDHVSGGDDDAEAAVAHLAISVSKGQRWGLTQASKTRVNL